VTTTSTNNIQQWSVDGWFEDVNNVGGHKLGLELAGLEVSCVDSLLANQHALVEGPTNLLIYRKDQNTAVVFWALKVHRDLIDCCFLFNKKKKVEFVEGPSVVCSDVAAYLCCHSLLGMSLVLDVISAQVLQRVVLGVSNLVNAVSVVKS
jgi:hypothetical protein